MDETQKNGINSSLAKTENIKWVLSKKSKLLIPQSKKLTGFEEKTLWDKLLLVFQIIGAIAIPLSIIIGLYQFTTQQQQNLQISTDQQQQVTLETYLDRMSDLLLTKNLLASKPNDEVRAIAHARTLTALKNLDPNRKGILLNFLYQANLINNGNTIVDLTFADLSNANLTLAYLYDANLSGANLDNVDLSESILTKSNLSNTLLNNANLSSSLLVGANLNAAFLFSANLDNANLEAAIVTDDQLGVALLKGATMPDGSIHP